MAFLTIGYVRAVGKACKYEEQFESLIHTIATPDSKVIVNLKSQESYLDKLKRKHNDPSRIHDVLRGAILTKTKDEVNQIVDNLKHECFTHGYKIYDMDYKDHPNPIGYMGSCHIKVQIQECIYEIQVMPEEIWSAKEITHSFYKSLASDKDLDPSVKRFSTQVFGTSNKSY